MVLTVERRHCEPTGPQRVGENVAQARDPEKTLEGQEKANPQTAMLGAQKNETKATDDNEEAEFEILTTVEKAIPGPEVLREGHRKQLNGCQCQEQAAEPGADLSAVRERELTRPHRDRFGIPPHSPRFDPTLTGHPAQTDPPQSSAPKGVEFRPPRVSGGAGT
jgi:hypothetical protein